MISIYASLSMTAHMVFSENEQQARGGSSEQTLIKRPFEFELYAKWILIYTFLKFKLLAIIYFEKVSIKKTKHIGTKENPSLRNESWFIRFSN